MMTLDTVPMQFIMQIDTDTADAHGLALSSRGAGSVGRRPSSFLFLRAHERHMLGEEADMDG
jgi:hypothetical protein